MDALNRLKIWEALIDLGFELKYLDIGGGLGIIYEDEEPPLPQEYADTIIKKEKI